MRTLSGFFILLATPALVLAADAPPPPPMPKKAVYSKPAPAKKTKRARKPSEMPSRPQTTVRYEGNKRIEEFRVKGRLTMVKVTPGNGKPYFIYYRENWNSAPGSSRDLDDTRRRPTWKIFSW